MTTALFAFLAKRYGRKAFIAWMVWEAAGAVATVYGGLIAGHAGGIL